MRRETVRDPARASARRARDARRRAPRRARTTPDQPLSSHGLRRRVGTHGASARRDRAPRRAQNLRPERAPRSTGRPRDRSQGSKIATLDRRSRSRFKGVIRLARVPRVTVSPRPPLRHRRARRKRRDHILSARGGAGRARRRPAGFGRDGSRSRVGACVTGSVNPSSFILLGAIRVLSRARGSSSVSPHEAPDARQERPHVPPEPPPVRPVHLIREPSAGGEFPERLRDGPLRPLVPRDARHERLGDFRVRVSLGGDERQERVGGALRQVQVASRR